MFYEGSDTFRDFGKLERYGINPTVTLKPTDTTKVKLSYEYYHDERTADRGNPSQGAVPAPRRPLQSDHAVRAERQSHDLLRQPDLNMAQADVQTGMAFIEHDFQNGLTVQELDALRRLSRSSIRTSIPATARSPAPSIRPTPRSISRPISTRPTATTSSTRPTSSTRAATGPVAHTVGFGTEFGRQTGVDIRNTGIFPNGTNTDRRPIRSIRPISARSTSFTIHRRELDGVTTPTPTANTASTSQSGYVRDTIEVTRWLQLIAGARFDRFDLSALDMNTNINRARVDNKVSPQAAVIVKPMENMSIYTAYSISYLPASGDQFSALNNGTLILQPQKFENKEVGMKWNILPRLQYTAAIYDLKRTNVPIADPNNPGFFLLSGSHRIRGFETGLNGYVTDAMAVARSAMPIPTRGSPAHTSATVVRRQPRAARAATISSRWWNKYQFKPIWAAARRRDLFLGLRSRRPTTPSGCRASCASTPASTPRSTRPGARSSMSRTSSTRAIGPPPTATTTSRRANPGPFASKRSRRSDREADRSDHDETCPAFAGHVILAEPRSSSYWLSSGMLL